MKQYNITLSEEEIERTKELFIKEKNKMSIRTYNQQLVDDNIIDKIKQAKQKPYTNFQKLKDEMTVDEFSDFITFGTKHFINFITKKYNAKNVTSKVEWLESEVAE